MSAIIGRVLLAVGIGVVAAVVCRIMENNRREQHSHRGDSRRRRREEDPSYNNNRSTWGDQDYSEDENDNSHNRTREMSSTGNRNGRKSEHLEESEESVQQGCPICLDTFRVLKRKGISIYSTPCGHLFCHKCLTQCVRTANVCPSCRKPTPLSSCHKIFL